MRITLVVAIAEGGVIGRAGGLPWRLPSDLSRFKALTLGHTLVMGRRTWESIGRALPGRRTIVVSRSGQVRVPEGVLLVESLAAALASAGAAGETEVFVVGGAELYRDALPLAERAVVTHVLAAVTGDTFFPLVDWSEWEAIALERVEASQRDAHAFEIVDYRRRRAETVS